MSTKEEKKKEGIITGIGCVIICAILVYFAITSMSNIAAVQLEGFLAALLGVLGGICLWKPATWGAYIAEYFKRLNSGSEKGSDSHNTQVQQNSDGSFQVIGDRQQINVNIPKEKQALKSSTMAKTFGCPNCAQGVECYPPDDNHPMASGDEDYVKKYALDGYLSRTHRCKNCGTKFTLYWYQFKPKPMEASHGKGFFG